ncbi:metallo-beta-lactamase superfamily protein [Mycobacterium kansasii]|uniref:Metallo-beta-lactamase superfamily protein n=1 Tax=Mycobacterium kansasii TaxID=1768 RepID=A0A1V3XST6_MYCKA|nr:metallo-beta-lactamase superfamily protein [Mycobacterium kansasii]
MNEDLPPPAPLAAGGLRVTALGGVGEIGRNMTVFEHLGRLLIIDCGVLFPTHDEPGVDLILPDLRHIEDRLDDIEALVLTHAHEDHIGAIPFLLKLRPDIPVVGSRFTLALVAAKCREHRIKPVFVEVAEGRAADTESSSANISRSTTPSPTHWPSRSIRVRAPSCTPATSSSTNCRSTDVPPTCPACPGSATPAWTCSCATPPTPRSPVSDHRKAKWAPRCTG